ncbi:MAG: molybdopterin molybdotransferase MoeA [Methylococcales bacterium]
MLADECANDSSQRMLSLTQAREIVASSILPLSGYEQIVLKNCSGRVLFDDIVAPFDIPRESQSSMDGYAFNSLDLNQTGFSRFKIAGTSWAGRPFTDPVNSGECVRIFTGATLPAGTDSVVIQESAYASGGCIEIPSSGKSKENIRTRGDEIHQGQRVLQKGKRLSPADMAILASLGIHSIRVRRRPRVAFFSTGDELVSLDKPLETGQIYDSNRYLLYGMLKALGIDPLDFGVVRDDRDAIVDALTEASAISDMLISCGGVSVGEADLVKQALASAGQIEFWEIAMKPGKPLAFGRIGPAHFFGLPGNPVSVFVTFYQLVRPALRHMMGANPSKALRLQAACVSKINKTPGRQEFQRGILFFDEAGMARVLPAEKQQSHNLSAMAECNCFIVLPAECEGVEAGKPVEVEPIDSAFHFN